jgi:hypothetical protein
LAPRYEGNINCWTRQPEHGRSDYALSTINLTTLIQQVNKFRAGKTVPSIHWTGHRIISDWSDDENATDSIHINRKSDSNTIHRSLFDFLEELVTVAMAFAMHRTSHTSIID